MWCTCTFQCRLPGHDKWTIYTQVGHSSLEPVSNPENYKLTSSNTSTIPHQVLRVGQNLFHRWWFISRTSQLTRPRGCCYTYKCELLIAQGRRLSVNIGEGRKCSLIRKQTFPPRMRFTVQKKLVERKSFGIPCDCVSFLLFFTSSLLSSRTDIKCNASRQSFSFQIL